LTSVPAPRRRRPAIFLDRDGVLNEVTVRDGVPHPPPSVGELRIIDGVVQACLRLRELGYILVVITNQPDLARGRQRWAEVDQIHEVLREQLPLDEIVVCPHDDADHCECRKPKPGMLLDAAQRLNLDLTASYCVGDRWRDVEAGERAGVRTIYIDRHYGERRPASPDFVAASLLDALPLLESRRSVEEIPA
jgi:D-glycero-D-manno-heptose 1,7-bisphosphate phosphatase